MASYSLTAYGVLASSNWYQTTPTFTGTYSSKYIGLGNSGSTYYNYGVFVYADLRSLSGASISAISLTVNCSAAPYKKNIAVGKKTNLSTTDYAYSYLQMTGEVAQGATSFTVNLTSHGLCPYGYVLWQNDQNSTYALNPITVTSATLTITVNNTVRIANGSSLDTYTVYVVENSTLVPYRVTVANGSSLDSYS